MVCPNRATTQVAPTETCAKDMKYLLKCRRRRLDVPFRLWFIDVFANGKAIGLATLRLDKILSKSFFKCIFRNSKLSIVLTFWLYNSMILI